MDTAGHRENRENRLYMRLLIPGIAAVFILLAIILLLFGVETAISMKTGLVALLAAALITVLLRTSGEKNKAYEHIRIIFDSMPFGVNIHNKNLDCIDCNEGALKLFGISNKQEYLEKFHLLSPEYQPDGRLSREKMFEKIDKALSSGYCSFEWMHQKLNGEPIPCNVTIVRVKLSNEYALAAYLHDLRELKATIEQVYESEQSLNLLENILNGIDAQIYVSVPQTGEILFMNNFMKNNYKIEGDCIGKYCYKIFMKNRDRICDFCPCYQLDKENFYEKQGQDMRFLSLLSA